MKTQRLLILIALVTVCAGIMLLSFSREPHYQGRSLTSWLQQCSDTPLDETQRLAEAQQAVRAMPAKKVLPRLLELVEVKDDPVSLWMIGLNDKFRIQFLNWQSAADFQQLGIAGFEVMGTNAAPVVEELAKLLDETDHASTAVRCLIFIGKPAEIVFCRALTNQNVSVRQWSVDNLAAVTDDVGDYLGRVKPRLEDASEAVRVTTVNDIGTQTMAPELAVPLLDFALKDASDKVCSHAINSLANFGTNALMTFPMLTNLVSRGGIVGSAALRASIIIAPEKALSIFTNCLALGNPNIDAALQALAKVMPDQAFPIILVRLQSPDIDMRRKAFGLLRHYPMTPQIESTMQTLATNPDPDIAPAAKGFLTDQYETSHPDALLFPNEPSYTGKRLGEWLGMHIDGGGDFTPAATNAIHQLGTNAIPALLKRLTYVRPAYCFNAWQINLNAASAFITLGELSKPTLPVFWLLMESTNEEVAQTAMIASFGTGSNAMPFVIKGLTNQFVSIRSLAAGAFTEGIGDKFPEQRKPAIPLFMKLLNDPDDDIRLNAANQLKQIDPAAALEAGIK